MDFKSAEQIINASLLANGPPLFVIGPNGIGKTEMLKAMAQPFRNTVFTTAIEYGGYKQYERILKDKKIKNLVLSDLQSITERPQHVRGNVVRILSSLTSEGTQFELTFSRDRPIEDFQKRKESFNLNVIIGGTTKHLEQLIREGHHDLLVRFIYIFVDRDTSTINFKEKYKLHAQPILRFDRKKLAEIELASVTINYSQLAPRENVLLLKLQMMLRTLELRPEGQIKFYRPLPSIPGKHMLNLDTRLVAAPTEL